MFANDIVPTAQAPEHIEAKLDFEILFQSVPISYLILLPDPPFTIAEVNEAYLAATLNQRENVIGKSVFEVFLDSPSDRNAASLRASLERVIRNRKADIMPMQEYDIPCKVSENGFEVRYWISHHVPVFGKQGTLDFIIHRIEDVTEVVRLKQQKATALTETETLHTHAAQMEAEIHQHSKEIGKTQEALRSSHERYQILTTILPVVCDFLNFMKL